MLIIGILQHVPTRFTQTLDHFNPQDSRTFQQRYMVYATL